MRTRVVMGFAAILLWAGVAHAQPRLTDEVFGRVKKGLHQLTEDEVIKLVPGPFTVLFGDEAPGGDYVLVWEEVRRIRVEFLDGKATSVTGTFSDVVTSKTLTLANAAKIAKGMKQPDVEKLLAGGGRTRGHLDKNFDGKNIWANEWDQGRVLRAYIKGGKLEGTSFLRFHD